MRRRSSTQKKEKTALTSTPIKASYLANYLASPLASLILPMFYKCMFGKLYVA